MLFQPPPGALSLQFHHMAEEAALFHQFRRSTLFCHPALREDNNLVRRFHGAHPVGDDQNSLAGEEAGEGFLNSALIFHVQAGGCLIQKDDRRIFQKRAGDGNPLAFAAGEGGAVLADHGLIALGQFPDKFIAPGGSGGCDHFLVRSAPAAKTDISITVSRNSTTSWNTME